MTGRKLYTVVMVALGVASPLVAQQSKPAKTTTTKAAAKPDSTPAKPAAPVGPPLSGAVGFVYDSVNGGPLVGAIVTIAGTDRQGITDSTGKFRVDSIPPGQYQIALFHALLDSLGLSIGTNVIDFPAGRYAVVALGTPGPATIIGSFCPKEKQIAGPGMLIGRVLDADTDEPAPGTKISMLWQQIEAGKTIGFHRIQRIREATVDQSGAYHICGIPIGIKAEVRATTPTFTSADLTADFSTVPIAIISMHVAKPDTTPAPPPPTVAAGDTVKAAPAAPAAPKVIGLRRGQAIVSGVVLSSYDKPVPGADVTVAGAESKTSTDSSGKFTLRGLPAGTQTLVVKRVSYAPKGVPVDLSSRTPRTVTVKLDPAPPSLPTVVVQAKWEQELAKVGFTDRKKSGLGRYLDRDQIEEHLPQVMTDVFETMPGIQVDYSTGQPVLHGSRTAGGGCVNYYIAGVPYKEQTPGDINDYMRPNELEAVEVYQSSETPGQFTSAGSSSCTTIVVWTKTRIGDLR
jgi:CarboxypepD_reg-like domain/Carboxypeptidase regulatory-like domain